ncbi:uncharacterized oxidoreductase TM_0325-like [Sitodiplosis mosellana]|uniref:uncharacterized oxidoreductase TM_0325-like n=1 Tax=Sitodiplosis mosellana TaxID=263140 RepID=UPI00244461CF|nr:uncharacterized oxidoreductase TM_0325-like [Sitodiplosis mosellana]
MNIEQFLNMSFDGKVALITGASSGIGADAARHLAKLGAKVSIVGRNEKRLNQVAEQIKSAGSPAPLVIVADVTKDAQRIVDETIKHFGKLDVLLNNAGVVIQDNVAEINLSEFDRIFDTNVRSVITLTKLCIPHLEKAKGNIVNVSSIAGLKAIPNVLTYCMSKAALDQFTKCSALDLASKGIRVNAINPAVIRTPIFQTVGVPVEAVEQMFEEYKTKYPVGRVGEVADTSAAIAFLADNKTASFLTGILFPVDGGSMVAGV